MGKPEFLKIQPPDAVRAEAAAATGLPMIDGLQVIGQASRKRPGEPAVTWSLLEDGTEVVRDDAGNLAEWPGA